MTKHTEFATEVVIKQNYLKLEEEFDSTLEIYHQNSGLFKEIKFQRVFPIETGKFKTVLEISDSFAKKNLVMTMETTGIVYNHHFFLTKKNETTNFACISVKDLFNGEKKVATYAQILRAAVGFKTKWGTDEYFVSFCYPQDATDIREQYLDQQKGEIIHMVMDPINDSMNKPRIFSLGNIAEEPALYSTNGSYRKYFLANELIMFRLTKKSLNSVCY